MSVYRRKSRDVKLSVLFNKADETFFFVSAFSIKGDTLLSSGL